MDQVTYEANKKIRYDLFELDLKEYKDSKNKEELINKYKEMSRFLLIITRDISLQKNETEFANFINNIIKMQTNDITMLNNSYKEGSIDNKLKNTSFHDKLNIYNYVKPSFYDYKYDANEILEENVSNILSKSIINEANEILKKYNTNLKSVKDMNIKDVYSLIDDKILALDILYASELI